MSEAIEGRIEFLSIGRKGDVMKGVMDEAKIADRVAGRVVRAGVPRWEIVSVNSAGVQLLLVVELGVSRFGLEALAQKSKAIKEQVGNELVSMAKAGLKVWPLRANLGGAVIESDGSKLFLEQPIVMPFLTGVEMSRDDVEEILTAGGWL